MTSRRPADEEEGPPPDRTGEPLPFDLDARFGRLMEALDLVAGHGDAPRSERGPITDAPLDPELQLRLEAAVRAFLDERSAHRPAAASPEALEAAVAPLFERLFTTASAWARERPELLGNAAPPGPRPSVDVRAILDDEDEDELLPHDPDAERR
jgi:hypothetical protein